MKDHFELILESAAKAASNQNSQPWKFRVDGNRICILPDFERAMPVTDPDNHELFISLGCAVENLVIAAANYGYTTQVNVVESGSGYIEALLTEALLTKAAPLFNQIEKRQTTRCKYNGHPVPQAHLTLLQQSAQQTGVELRLLTSEEEREVLIELVREACARQFENPAFVEERQHWIRFNHIQAKKTQDGLANAATGCSEVPGWLGRLVRTITLQPDREADKREDMLLSSSGLAVFVGGANDLKSWVNIGRSFQRFSLQATFLNIRFAHENSVCEELPVREKLADFLNLKEGQRPFLLIRFGYANLMPTSYRRPLEEIVAIETAAN